MARADTSLSDSPLGNRAAEGWPCTTFQIGSLTSSLMSRPVQSPYPHSVNSSSTCSSSSRPAALCAAWMYSAVSMHRSSGLDTIALSGRTASPFGNGSRLLLAALIEVNSGAPADQHRPGQRSKPVTHQQEGGHQWVAFRTPVESSTINKVPIATRYQIKMKVV